MFVNTIMFYSVYNIISPNTVRKSPHDRITKKSFLMLLHHKWIPLPSRRKRGQRRKLVCN